MKKIILILSILCLSVVRASAQTAILPPILGDMNDDGKLSVVDITLLVNVNKGNIPTLFTNLEDFSYIVNNEKVIGTWYSTQDGSSITFNPDSTTDYHNAATYEFYPNKNRILVYDALGYIVHAIFLTEITDQYMDVIDYSTNVTTRYIKSTSWVLISGITLTPSTLNMSPGETSQLTATTIPSDAINTEVTWTSSNENVATVDTNGLVTAVAGGSCTITCAATDGSGVTATCEVTITQLVTSITLSHSTLTLPVDGFQRLTATVLPDNAVNKTVTWSSSDEDVAEVTRTGGVSAVSTGTCTITCAATDGSGVTATCSVTVANLVTDITITPNEVSMDIGETSTLTTTILPTNATITAVTWSSSNDSVAIVDANGLVTAIAVGTSTITCAATDGSRVKGICVVGVNETHEYIDFDLPSGTLWATYNLGMYAWGETTTKSDFGFSNYKHCKGSQTTLTKYCYDSSFGYNGFTDTLTELEPEDDVASVNWGPSWHIPSQAQWQELFKYTTATETTQNEVSGVKFTRNGKSIFLPAAGYQSGSSVTNAGYNGYYWSRTLSSRYTWGGEGYYFGVNGSHPMNGWEYRSYGKSVRPVRDSIVGRVSGISLSHPTLKMDTGATQQLAATILPANAANKYVRWISSNTSVATVDANGLVTAIAAAGTCTITCAATDGSGVTATCVVTVGQYTTIMVSSITLNPSSLIMSVGTTSSLTAIILPTNVSNNNVRWTSSNIRVATVDANGLVTAVDGGSCTITCIATDGSGTTGTCVVGVNETHEYVDLGLPSGILWATCNIGATSPEDYGDYFAWGEVMPRNTYAWSTYKYYNGSMSMTKYCTVDNKTELDPEDDTAYTNWGPAWRMPSKAQFDELINSANTTTLWTTQNGIYGRKITSKSNGNSIFLPAAGYRNGTSLYVAGSNGYYWSRTLSYSSSNHASGCGFTSSSISNTNYPRYYGLSVRPVRLSQ